jgi:peptidoglycan/LPS O-acetylase OafA/YrhL
MQKRFGWLDGARGIAAIAVMLFHYESYLHLRPWFRSSFLAVDLFFIMSGFVLAHSYGGKLDSGAWSVGRFLYARLVRLWPTYALATALGAGYYLSKALLRTPDAPAVSTWLGYLLPNLLFLPSLVHTPSLPGMFPFAPASWSLSTEMIASLAFGTLLFRLRTTALLAFCLATSLAFVALAYSFRNFDLGWGLPTFYPGMIRTLGEFSGGMLLYRLHRSRSERAGPGVAAFALASLLTLATLLILHPRSLTGMAVAVFAIYPAFLLLGARTPIGGLAETICHELGRLSYPLYLLHTPVLLWFAGLWKLAAGQDPAKAGAPVGIAMAAVALLVSYAVGRWVEEPIRKGAQELVRRLRSRLAMQSAAG